MTNFKTTVRVDYIQPPPSIHKSSCPRGRQWGGEVDLWTGVCPDPSSGGADALGLVCPGRPALRGCLRLRHWPACSGRRLGRGVPEGLQEGSDRGTGAARGCRGRLDPGTVLGVQWSQPAGVRQAVPAWELPAQMLSNGLCKAHESDYEKSMHRNLRESS